MRAANDQGTKGLLEACKLLVREWDKQQPTWAIADIVEAARTAIAKAEQRETSPLRNGRIDWDTDSL